MKIITFLLFCLCFLKMESRTITVTTFDSINWDSLPEKYNNSNFCVVDGKTGNLVAYKSFKNGKKHGLFLRSIKSNSRFFYIEENYKKGFLHGFFNGYENSGFYKKGKKHREWKFSNDISSSKKINYKNGKKHGKYYFTDGVFEEVGSYKNGKKHGKWVMRDINDDKEEAIIKVYKKGVLIKQ